jgi:steroid delta-isomerase-like uncharacterized protein
MSLDSNKQLARRAIEVWSRGDVDALAEIFAPDYINHQHSHPQSPADIVGLKAWGDFIIEFHRAFPDFLDTIELQIAEGNHVATRFISRGTHEGTFMGISATGRTVSWSGISIDRIENERIVESWGNWDMMGVFQQLGAPSTLGSTS